MLSLAAALVAVSLQATALPVPELATSPAMRLFQTNNAPPDDDKPTKRRPARKAAPKPPAKNPVEPKADVAPRNSN